VGARHCLAPDQRLQVRTEGRGSASPLRRICNVCAGWDRVKENLGAAEVSLSDEDMAAVEAHLARIKVTGERLPPAILKLSYR
jgi:hypothetical protein